MGPADVGVRADLPVPGAWKEPRAWRHAEVPNPWKDPESCGLPQPGWLCDPDDILSPEGRVRAMDVLLAIRGKTQVQCPDGQRGYQVGVALVRWMHPDDWVGDKGDTAKLFAQEIGNRWGVGDPGCDNGVMVLFSIGDRFAYIKTATASQDKLTDSLSTTIVDNMKPLLREERYDDAALQAAIQIDLVFEGKEIPGATWEPFMTLVSMILFCCLFLPPLIIKLSCGLLMVLLMPFAWFLDGLVGCMRKVQRRHEQWAAEQDLQRVQRELSRSEHDQTICPICLESLQGAGRSTALDCRHQFHRACIDPWVQQHGSCPLCRADVEAPLAPEDEARSQEYQRRLRFYMSRVRHQHRGLFANSSSTPYYRRHPHSGDWIFYSDPSRYGHSSLSGSSFASSLQHQYQNVTRGMDAWLTSANTGSRRGSGGFSSLEGGFGGGGGFDDGGGGGGGW